MIAYKVMNMIVSEKNVFNGTTLCLYFCVIIFIKDKYKQLKRELKLETMKRENVEMKLRDLIQKMNEDYIKRETFQQTIENVVEKINTIHIDIQDSIKKIKCETIECKTYDNGDKYIGWMKNDQRCGKGNMTYANGNVYEGYWKDDNKHGEGSISYANGDFYDGDWKNNNRCGEGYYKWNTGAYYEGEWKDGYVNGQGIITYSNGDVYEGEWMGNKKHGSGVMTYANGGVYKGEWVGDKKDGDGTYKIVINKDDKMDPSEIMLTGGVYEGLYKGEWKNNDIHGQGTYKFTNSNGGIRTFRGRWFGRQYADNKIVGEGIHTHFDLKNGHDGRDYPCNFRNFDMTQVNGEYQTYHRIGIL